MGNKSSLWLAAGLLFLGQSAGAISDSLVSMAFETEVALKATNSISRYKSIRQLLMNIDSGNRNDIYYVKDLTEKYGDQAMPKLKVVGSRIRIEFEYDRSEIEIVSSLERVYLINEIKVQMSATESYQDSIQRMQRVFKSRKQRVVRFQWLWEFLLGNRSLADDSEFLDKHPKLVEDSPLWGVIAVAIENQISATAKSSLMDHAPVAAALASSIKSDFGDKVPVEISCTPRYININDSDRGDAYPELLNRCCSEEKARCPYLINSMSNAAHPYFRTPAKFKGQSIVQFHSR